MKNDPNAPRLAQPCANRGKRKLEGSKPSSARYDEMRQKLGVHLKQHLKFDAIFVRNGGRDIIIEDDGIKRKVNITTFLFRQIRLNGELVAEHIWLDSCPNLREAELTSGDTVSFFATVIEYTKIIHSKADGAATAMRDYKLMNPKTLEKTGHLPGWMPQEEWKKIKDAKRKSKSSNSSHADFCI